MKAALIKLISVLACVALIVSAFAACGKNGTEDTTVTQADSSDISGDWSQGVPDASVEISEEELNTLVKKALGGDAKSFKGDLSALSEAQLKKVVARAQADGYIVETADDGTVTIKKNITLIALSDGEVVELVKTALGDDGKTFDGDLSKLSGEQLALVENAADNKGYYVVTDAAGNVSIQKEDRVADVTPDEKKEVSEVFKEVLGEEAATFSGDVSDLNPEKQKELESKLADMELSPSEAAEIITAVPTTRAVTTTAATTKKTTTTTKKSGKVTTTKKATVSTESKMKTTKKVTAMVSEWTKNFSNKTSSFADVVSDGKGGAVAVGTEFLVQGVPSADIVKYDKNGKVEWKDTISADRGVYFETAIVLKDGSIIAGGYSFAKDLSDYNITFACGNGCLGTCDCLLVKYSASGKRQWVKLFGGAGSDMVMSLAEAADGGILVGGNTTSTDGDFSKITATVEKQNSAFLVRFNPEITSISWGRFMNSTKYCAVEGLSVAANGDIFAAYDVKKSDGDFASIPGASNGIEKTLIVKFNSAGVNQWQTFLTSTNRVYATAIETDGEGGCYVGGYYSAAAPKTDFDGRGGTFSDVFNGGNSGTGDGFILKIGSNGAVEWKTMFIGFGSEFLEDIELTDNGIIAIGHTNSTNRDFSSMPGRGDFDAFVCALNRLGTKQAMIPIGGSGMDKLYGVCASPDGSLFVCGSTASPDGDFAGQNPAASATAAASFISKINVTLE